MFESSVNRKNLIRAFFGVFYIVGIFIYKFQMYFYYLLLTLEYPHTYVYTRIRTKLIVLEYVTYVCQL